MEIKDYQTIKFKCSQCDEGQYYSKGEQIQCPYCGANDKQTLVEVVHGVEEASVSMTKEDWRSVLESFEALPYPEDWNEEGKLTDEQDEAIRQKLTAAAK